MAGFQFRALIGRPATRYRDRRDNGVIYLSYAEAGEDNLRGAAVMRATLMLTEDGGPLSDQQVIWRQDPKVTGRGHYGHRIAFSDAGYLLVREAQHHGHRP